MGTGMQTPLIFPGSMTGSHTSSVSATKGLDATLTWDGAREWPSMARDLLDGESWRSAIADARRSSFVPLQLAASLSFAVRRS